MKKSIVIAIVVALLTIANSAFAQVDSTTIGAYAMIQAPTNDGENSFTNRFAVAKLAGYAKNTKIGIQYDFASSCLIEAEGMMTYGNFTISAGATFTAAGQITPAPNGLNTEWWYEVFNSYTFLGNGIGMSYANGPLTAYAVRTDMFSAAILYRGFQALYQENYAGSVAYEGSWNKLVNPFIGVTFFNPGLGKSQFTASNFVQVNDNLRLYGVVDWGKVKEERVGLAYTVNPNAKVVGYYNVEANKTFLEAVFSF